MVVYVLATKWKIQRKKIVFTFRPSIISQYVPMMIKYSENMTKSLKNTESIDVEDLISFVGEHTLNILCGIVFKITHNFIINVK